MRLSLGIVALVVCLFPSVLAARPNEPKAAEGFRLSGGTSARVSTSTLLLHRESAGPDTFDLYGGPRRLVRDPDGIPGSGDEYVEGKFEDASASVPRGLSTAAGDWTGVDLTEIDIHSRIHDFNCENLNDNGPGNLALWVEASVVVYDLRGKQVRRLFDGTAASADLRLVWDGRDDGGSRVASGIYLVGARTEGFRGTRKVALIK